MPEGQAIDLPEIQSRRIFPPVENASPEGLVAVGGTLSPEVLLNAYSHGIFPWYSDDRMPVLWWSPDPRMILFFDDLHISRSMRRVFNRQPFSVTFDRDFDAVIQGCREPRPSQPETWITDNMAQAYTALHELGFAHSLEVWHRKRLAGGIYGLALGRCFFGESMFSRQDNASKFAFIRIARNLQARGYHFLDCQVSSNHLKTMGASEISRRGYLEKLQAGLAGPTDRANWGKYL
jgi:leucyl/phenylalanyl-tRNA--protein transferase